MTLRLVALLLGAGVALYRHFRHYDDWQASVFYGFIAASLVHTIAGFGDDAGMDYEGLRRDR